MEYANPSSIELHCRDHGLLTCLICLHSINSKAGGLAPIEAPIPCPESAHSVAPLFEGNHLSIRNISRLGFQDGLSPEDRIKYRHTAHLQVGGKDFHRTFFYCPHCQLSYLAGGGPGMYASHPSHIGPDGQRYLKIVVFPWQFLRKSERIACTSTFVYGHNSDMNISYECAPNTDYGTAGWNLDNALIATLIMLLRDVEHRIIPLRKRLVEPVVYTNSEYFAGQAWRFRLIVIAPLRPELLNFLLMANSMKYSHKHRAYVERNGLGITIARWPVTEERRYQTVTFIRMVKSLAERGIDVQWKCVEPDEVTSQAMASFMNQPYNSAQEVVDDSLGAANEEQDALEEEELLEGDSSQYISDHHDYEAIERTTPSMDDRSQWDSAPRQYEDYFDEGQGQDQSP